MSYDYRFVFAVILFGLTQILTCRTCLGEVKRHDTVIMKNGDRLTGEVKRLENGVLYIKTDYFSGSVGVDWLQVEKVESTATYQIVLTDGNRLTGKISKIEAESAPGKGATFYFTVNLKGVINRASLADDPDGGGQPGRRVAHA